MGIGFKTKIKAFYLIKLNKTWFGFAWNEIIII
jgi:hypothetical protein